MYEKCIYLQVRMVYVYGVYAVFQQCFVVGHTLHVLIGYYIVVCTELHLY